MRVPHASLAGALALATAAVPALAHDGHVRDGLFAGLAHPLGGVDHLLATLGIGLVAGLVAVPADRSVDPRGTSGSTGLRVVLAGALGLLAGAAWSMLSGRAPGLPALPGGVVEGAAALGLLVLALALVRAERIGAGGLAALALAVALPHGWLHAAEGGGAGFFAGLAAASAALFAVGHVLGRAAGSRPASPGRAGWTRWAAAAGYAAASCWLATAALR